MPEILVITTPDDHERSAEEAVLLRERDVQAVSSQPAGSKDRAPGQYL